MDGSFFHIGAQPALGTWLASRQAPSKGAALLLLLVLFSLWRLVASAQANPVADWPSTEGAPGGGRYSPLAEIHRGNVAQLTVAWTYRHGDSHRATWHPAGPHRSTAFEATPIVVDERLIFTTPYNRVIALHPETGHELWTFDPQLNRDRFFANMMINRGVAYWRETSDRGACSQRVFLATLDARLIALDAATGSPCREFGDAGTVNLLTGLQPVIDDWEYNLTSPPTIVGDVVIVGSSVADTVRRIQAPGDVRGFDARTGALRWTFHTIPQPGEFGHDTWENHSWKEAGAANVWTTMTADLQRGLVFLPVSSASPDFYGGDRPGANLFSDALVALDAATGQRVWYFQTVHHDIWDYDLPAPPNLVRVHHHGQLVDAVAQVTKIGLVFVFNRDTGAPLFPVEERPVPPSDVPGEQAWPTQPFPTRPPPLSSHQLTEADLWQVTPAHFQACREQLHTLRNAGIFTPPSVQGTIVHPSNGGGANWSGAAFEPQRRRLFVPVNDFAHIVQLKPVWGAASNLTNLTAQPTRSLLRGLWFLLTGRGTGLRYLTHPLTGRVSFAHKGKPCLKPPWGSLVAVGLDKGTILWRVPAGEQDGVKGLFGYGPPLVTAGGLLFHAGTQDLRLRAHDVDTGEVLATFALPAGLHAGPITYKLRPDGKQYLVIAPGGHAGLQTQLGDYVLAYTLPDDHPADFMRP